ncbi:MULTISPECIES: hypothetical protein [Falsihalocynthiibacter]|uniref:hypothetical protein n=1 Tax=Falsihalocynthiibacter TaxID=2854182 RepID=UPI00300252B7
MPAPSALVALTFVNRPLEFDSKIALNFGPSGITQFLNDGTKNARTKRWFPVGGRLT